MIGIIDYGMGNLHSVSKALERLGHDYRFISRPDELTECDGVILPGVGAFGDAMANLQDLNMVQPLREYAAGGQPLLGICLGMQLLFEQSEEHGIHQGLGILPGEVARFTGDFKIPHMGWNKLAFMQDAPVLHGVEEGYVYFVHSYYVRPGKRDVLWAVSDYFQEVPAVVGRNKVCGMQFHPEKSGEVGMKMLANFASQCREVSV